MSYKFQRTEPVQKLYNNTKIAFKIMEHFNKFFT